MVQLHQCGNICVADYIIAIRQQDDTLRIKALRLVVSMQLESLAWH